MLSSSASTYIDSWTDQNVCEPSGLEVKVVKYTLFLAQLAWHENRKTAKNYSNLTY